MWLIATCWLPAAPWMWAGPESGTDSVRLHQSASCSGKALVSADSSALSINRPHAWVEIVLSVHHPLTLQCLPSTQLSFFRLWDTFFQRHTLRSLYYAGPPYDCTPRAAPMPRPSSARSCQSLAACEIAPVPLPGETPVANDSMPRAGDATRRKKSVLPNSQGRKMPAYAPFLPFHSSFAARISTFGEAAGTENHSIRGGAPHRNKKHR